MRLATLLVSAYVYTVGPHLSEPKYRIIDLPNSLGECISGYLAKWDFGNDVITCTASLLGKF